MNDVKLLNLATCSRELNIPVRWLKNKAREGKIPYLHISNGKYLFNLEATKTAIAIMAMNNELQTKGGEIAEPVLGEGMRRRIIKTLEWMVADMKHRFDDCRNNFEVSSGYAAKIEAGVSIETMTGGYSPELAEAIELLTDLKKGVRCHDEQTLKAAYEKGFEDAKVIIQKKIRELVD